MTRRKLLVLALLVACVAVASVGTLAYFTQQETAYNVITTGTLSMKLHDETINEDGELVPFPAWDEANGEGGIPDTMPATAVDKLVYIENTGDVDMYARIKLTQYIVPAKGVEDELNFDYITLDLNETEWIKQGDYYYYYRALLAGETTEKLFTKVTFGPELGNEYMDCVVHIVVDAQTVQAKNNSDSPLTATGWSE